MDQAVLVDQDIDAGRELVQALDARKEFPVTAAMWFLHEDSGEYRLRISSPYVARRGSNDAYAFLADALERSELNQRLPLIRIEAVPPGDQLVNAVRRLVRTGRREIAGTRLRNNLANGVLIPDAYVYRAA